MSGPVIELSGVGRALGGAPILADLDLAVDAGELLLITGRSGAGKTTLLRLLCAAEPPDEGKVALFGRDVARLRASSLPALRRRIGVVFQDLKLFADRSALANVALALEVQALPRRELRVRAAEALAAVGLAAASSAPERSEGAHNSPGFAGRGRGWLIDARIDHLSVGEQQRVAIARAIAVQPAILLADEPTAHLDPAAARELVPLLRAQAAAGAAVVMTTNDGELVAAAVRAGSRHLVLDEGRLRAGELADQVAGAAENVVPLRRAKGVKPE